MTLEQIHAAEVREPFSPSNFHPSNAGGFPMPPHAMFLQGLSAGGPKSDRSSTSPITSTANASGNGGSGIGSFSTSLAALENQVRTITTTFATPGSPGSAAAAAAAASTAELSALAKLRRQQKMMRILAAANGGQPLDSAAAAELLMMNMNELDDDDLDDEEEEDLSGEIDDGGSSPMSGISSSDWVFEHPGRPIQSPFPVTPLDLTSAAGTTTTGEKNTTGSGNSKERDRDRDRDNNDRNSSGRDVQMNNHDAPRTHSNKSDASGSSANSMLHNSAVGPPPGPGGLLLLPNNVTPPGAPGFLSFLQHAGQHPFNLVHGPRPRKFIISFLALCLKFRCGQIGSK